jgi:hypothetical protein
MHRRPPLIAALAASALALSACAAVSGGASVVSLIATKKTIMDHVVSFALEQDCSTIQFERGEPYCSDPNEPGPVQPVYHCYRSLGEISCYEIADPYRDGAAEVR